MRSRDLLNIMSVRLAMLESGVAKPHPVVAVATRLLVERLSVLPPDEVIQVAYTENPLHVQYIRQSSGEILSEWRHPDPEWSFDQATNCVERQVFKSPDFSLVLK